MVQAEISCFYLLPDGMSIPARYLTQLICDKVFTVSTGLIGSFNKLLLYVYYPSL